MLGLGKQVLNKIQSLLVEIDRKKVKKNNHDQIQKSKSKQKINSYRQSSEVYNKQKSKHQNSLIQQEKQNVCSDRLEQLYLNHFVRQKKLLDRNLQKLECQAHENKSFKVQNKTSQFLNQKKILKPIHQRTNEILRKRDKSIQKIKSSAPKNKRQIEQQQGERILQERKLKYPKMTKEQFERKMEQIQRRNSLRIQQLQKKKLMNLQEKSMLYLQKPQIHPSSKAWWDKKKLSKNLSTNVFERFKQYDMDKKQKWQKYLLKRKQQQTPFTPRISEASKQIARKSHSRRSLFDNIHRSHSCNALSKHQELSFVDRKEESTERKEESVERRMSKSRNLKHGKSATTMNSSRHALIERRVFE